MISNQTKTALIDIYRRATIPYRAWTSGRLTRQGRAPVVVLYYHRVADTDPVAWSLTNRQFAAHIDWLSDRFEMISMEEAQRRIASGVNRRPAVHISFDDGYAENCRQALPLLIERKIPCTYFVTLQNVVDGKPFAHDVEAGYSFPVNTPEQLRELAGQGIEIAAHTRTHPDLGQMRSPERLFDEIVTARRQLADLLGRPVRYFAFPFGLPANLNSAAAALAKADGVEGVCSAYGGYNLPGDAPFHIRRCHGDPELSRLRNTMTLDPRHLYRGRFMLDAECGPSDEVLAYYRKQAIEASPPALPLATDAACDTPICPQTNS